jgi:hypothetical protein
MARQRGFCLCAAFLFLAGWSTAQNKPANGPLGAHKTASDLPKVIRASVPFYPELARQTRIQGTVTLITSSSVSEMFRHDQSGAKETDCLPIPQF